MTNKFFGQPAWTLAGPCFDLVLNWDSLVSSLSDWGISSQIVGAREERLFLFCKKLSYFFF